MINYARRMGGITNKPNRFGSRQRAHQGGHPGESNLKH